jgi:hypothetical protein
MGKLTAPLRFSLPQKVHGEAKNFKKLLTRHKKI